MPIPSQNKCICTLSMQKLRCQIQKGASLLHSKDQPFNYFKHKMFAGTQEAVSQIIWETQTAYTTAFKIHHCICSIRKSLSYSKHQSTWASYDTNNEIIAAAQKNQMLSINSTQHSERVPQHPTCDKASSCSLLSRCVAFLNTKAIKRKENLQVLSGS